MKNLNRLYQEYGEYNILYNQLNMPSPSVEHSWRRTKKLLHDELLKIINRLIINDHKKQIIISDIGCGNGALLIRLAESTRSHSQKIVYRGFEISSPFVNYANRAVKYKNLTNISFHNFDVEKDNFSDKSDIVICSEVLEHLHKPKQVINKIYQTIDNGGYLLLSTPNSKNLIKYPFLFLKKIVSKKDSKELGKFLTNKEREFKLADLEQHLYVFSHGELIALLKEVGFSVYKTPRSTTLFGGPFLDNHISLFSLTIILDYLFDAIRIPQVGWDIIAFAKK